MVDTLTSDELYNGADQVHKWLTWAYWTSPVMYIQTAVSVNEFRSKSWKDVSSCKPFLDLQVSHETKIKLLCSAQFAGSWSSDFEVSRIFCGDLLVLDWTFGIGHSHNSL